MEFLAAGSLRSPLWNWRIDSRGESFPLPRASFYAATGHGVLSAAALQPGVMLCRLVRQRAPDLARASAWAPRPSSSGAPRTFTISTRSSSANTTGSAFHSKHSISGPLPKSSRSTPSPTEYVCRPDSRSGPSSRAASPKKKLIQVPYGVDLRRFTPEPKQDSVFRVLFVGGLSIRKGVHVLLEPAAPLVKAGEFELLLVGAVAEIEPFMRRYEGKSRHLGVVPNAELRRVYGQASVFSLLSFEEGLAMVQAEAMACGLPLVVTPNTGSEDIMTDGVHGIMVEPGNVEQIREAFLRLKNDSELRASMAQKALEKSQQNLSWQRYGDENRQGVSRAACLWGGGIESP